MYILMFLVTLSFFHPPPHPLHHPSHNPLKTVPSGTYSRLHRSGVESNFFLHLFCPDLLVVVHLDITDCCRPARPACLHVYNTRPMNQIIAHFVVAVIGVRPGQTDRQTDGPKDTVDGGRRFQSVGIPRQPNNQFHQSGSRTACQPPPPILYRAEPSRARRRPIR